MRSLVLPKESRKYSVLAVASIVISGCASIPNVSSFNEQTARLRIVNSAEFNDISSAFGGLIDSADRQRLDGRMEQNDFDEYKKQWQEQQTELNKLAREFNKTLGQAVAYSEAMAELAAAGKKGGEAAESLMESLNGFSGMFGGPALFVAGDTAANIIGKIADAYTRRQALQSLSEAVTAAQPAVDAIADGLAEAYAGTNTGSRRNLIEGLYGEQLRRAKNSHGRNAVNFCNTAQQFYDAYYFDINKRITPRDSNGVPNATNWKGFCKDRAGNADPTCRTVSELQALRLVRELHQAIRPVCDSYVNKVVRLQEWHKDRMTNARIISAGVQAWAREHRRIAAAISEERSFSASELKAILDEILVLTIRD